MHVNLSRPPRSLLADCRIALTHVPCIRIQGGVREEEGGGGGPAGLHQSKDGGVWKVKSSFAECFAC